MDRGIIWRKLVVELCGYHTDITGVGRCSDLVEQPFFNNKNMISFSC